MKHHIATPRVLLRVRRGADRLVAVLAGLG